MVHINNQGFIERGGWHWDFHPPGKVSPLQVLKKYSRANGMQGADFMWMKLLSIECMIQLIGLPSLKKISPSQTKILYETLTTLSTNTLARD